MSIAKTIHSQIKTIDYWALGAWGAKDLVAMNDGLKFKSSGMVGWKGQVYVKYNEGTDLYDIEFFRIRGAKVFVDDIVEGVFVEDLVNVIDAQIK
jgi:hypothetical protein